MLGCLPLNLPPDVQPTTVVCPHCKVQSLLCLQTVQLPSPDGGFSLSRMAFAMERPPVPLTGGASLQPAEVSSSLQQAPVVDANLNFAISKSGPVKPVPASNKVNKTKFTKKKSRKRKTRAAAKQEETGHTQHSAAKQEETGHTQHSAAQTSSHTLMPQSKLKATSKSKSHSSIAAASKAWPPNPDDVFPAREPAGTSLLPPDGHDDLSQSAAAGYYLFPKPPPGPPPAAVLRAVRIKAPPPPPPPPPVPFIGMRS